MEDVTAIVGAAGCFWCGYLFARDGKAIAYAHRTRLSPKFLSLMIPLLGLLIGSYGIIQLDDFVTARREVIGNVTNKYIRHSRYRASYYVDIEGRRFPTTFDVYDKVSPSTYVHAMVGRRTGNIFTVTE